MYRDADVERGEDILDCWGLMHLCFGQHPGIRFSTSRVMLTTLATLGDLTAAPYFEEHWKSAEAAPLLLELLGNCQANLVAVWCQQMLDRFHASFVESLPIEQLRALLEDEKQSVRQFAATALKRSKLLAAASLQVWFELMTVTDPLALTVICEAFVQHVDFSQVSWEGAVQLATRQPTPVARLGLEILEKKTNLTDDDLARLSDLAHARCSAIGQALALWALPQVASEQHYQTDAVLAFFDSPQLTVRQGAWSWLHADPMPAHEDSVLWSRLLETPYDDVRMELVTALERRTRSQAASLAGSDLPYLWSSVLLGIFRGGRKKALAVRQVAQAMEQDPTRSAELLPVLAVAVRSIRGPEQRAGLSAVARLLERRPELLAEVQQHLPELEMVPITELPDSSGV